MRRTDYRSPLRAPGKSAREKANESLKNALTNTLVLFPPTLHIAPNSCDLTLMTDDLTDINEKR